MASNPASKPVAVATRPSLVQKFAAKYNVEAEKLLTTLKHTAFKVKEGEVSNEQMMGLLIVADQYGLNPFTREIFAFPDKQNGIVPVVSVDGWNRIINDHDEYDGLEFRYSEERIKPGDKRCPGLKWEGYEWIECVLYRKDRTHPFVVREFLEEVYRAPFTYKDGGTKESAWQTHTKRFHRHKALIQGARLAFGFAGIYDEDEAMRIVERDVTPEGSHTTTAPQMPRERAGEDDPKVDDAESAKVVEGEVQTRSEQQQGKPADSKPAPESMVAMIRKKMEQATVSTEEIAKQLKIPRPAELAEGAAWDPLVGISLDTGNAILAWLRDPS